MKIPPKFQIAELLIIMDLGLIFVVHYLSSFTSMNDGHQKKLLNYP
jgi:hypothetical protein